MDSISSNPTPRSRDAWFGAFFILVVVLGLALTSVLVYGAVHFISKVW